MKKFLLIFLLILNSYGSSYSTQNKFLEPRDAFKFSFVKKEDSLSFKIDLAKDIYLYDDKIKVSILEPSKIDITKDLKFKQAVKYDEFMVHFNSFEGIIPYSLIKSKVDLADYQIEVKYQGCSKAGLCYAPIKEKYSLKLEDKNNISTNIQDTQKLDNKTLENLSESDLIANSLKEGNILLILATFFGFGLLLSLTPCIFPMIPILSSIIVKAGDNGKLTVSKGFFLSLIYVISMAIAYTIAGVIAGLFGANLQVALQNPYVLVSFSLIFVALAFSMFGYYKLELPQSLQNKINKTTEGKEKQGIIGIAIMGFLSALIVGPCVAPPLAGALVYIGQTGDAFLGGLALFVMSIGMGIPLLLIGLGAGKFMPKPGGWMDGVSKIFGIVMLGVAVWMLDRVLPSSVIMILWALLFLGAALYLRVYKHILVQLITLVIFLYGSLLFIGAVSGATNPLSPLESFTNAKQMQKEEYLHFEKVKNIKELESKIKASSRPIMLDFYADWCVACKELETITFKDPKVINKLKEFTLLKADVTENNNDDKDLQKRFEIVGPPGIIFWDKEKKEIKSAKIVGYKNPKEFLSIINKYFH